MQSEKKLKIPSFLSLPTLSIQLKNKQHLIKPLQLSDIIIVIIEQQFSVDKTEELKQYLTQDRKKSINLDSQDKLIKSSLQNLPDFAKKQWGFTHLLIYHLSRKSPNLQDEIAHYQRKLLQINHQFSNSLEKYKCELESGKIALQKIQGHVNSLYEITLKTKRHIGETHTKIDKFTKKIVANTRRSENILKTIAIAKTWSNSNISKILSKNLTNIENEPILELMKQISSCSNFVKEQVLNGGLQNFDKILKVIDQKKCLIIKQVEKNMVLSIVKFTDFQTYSKTYQQYNDLLKSLVWVNQDKFKEYHQLQKHNLKDMIKDNIDHIYWASLEEVSTVNNIQLLRQQAYSDFFTQLICNYNSYMVKWHKVTSFHVNSNTSHQENFLKLLDDVAAQIIKKVFHLIKYSSKFFSLSFKFKVKIILEVNKLVEFLGEWTGKKDQSIFQLFKEKLVAQIDNFRKETNGMLKVIFIDEFSEEGLMPKRRKLSDDNFQQDKSKFETFQIKKSTIQNQDQQIRQLAALKQIVNKILLADSSNASNCGVRQNHTVYSLTETVKLESKFNQNIKELSLESFELSLSKFFVKSIEQYCQKQQILPFGHLQYIMEHFQFLILLIFKVCVHQDVKKSILEDFSDKAFAKLKDVELAIDKNPSQESLIAHISKMRLSLLTRRNYLGLYRFLTNEIGQKFSALSISGFVNINKLYASLNENEQILKSYHTKLSKLIQQLLKISRWLIINQRHFRDYQKYSIKISSLPDVLIQLMLIYFQHYNWLLYQRYLEIIEPLMKNLKWKIQKFNQETTLLFRDYKINLLQIYRSSTLNIGIKDKKLYQELNNKHLEVFYRALLYLYCKIDKINDNGRQILRLDAIEISKILTEVGYNPGSWAVWLEKFIESTMERSLKGILEQINKLGIMYPIYCWKSQLLWIVGNLSSKQKKDYTSHLLRIYVDRLKQAGEC